MLLPTLLAYVGAGKADKQGGQATRAGRHGGIDRAAIRDHGLLKGAALFQRRFT
jgi:hypothetical protein